MSSDWDEPLLTEKQIEELKAEHGPLFKTVISGQEFLFRTITRTEATSIGLVDGEIDPELEEEIFMTSMVYPGFVDFDAIPAGAPSMVSQEILERSGLSGSKWLNEYLNRARSRQTAYHTIAATVCAAFPSVMPAQLDDLDPESLMDLVVQAEEILVIKARVNSGQYAELSFVQGTEGSTELSQQDKDAMVRAMLEGGMEDVPQGWIDRTKVPDGANYFDPDNDDI
jgi:hypothetical protein